MNKVSRGLALVVLVVLGLFPRPAVGDTGQIVVYFDSLGTQRAKDTPGIGVTDTVYIFAEEFAFSFLSGAQYRVDYGPHLSFITDFDLPGVFIGNSAGRAPFGGISLAFGLSIKSGKKALIHKALVTWTADSCSDLNSNFPKVERNTDFPEPTAVVTRFPDETKFPAFEARSQTCQYVELDIQPGECPNAFDSTLWDSTGVSDRKGGVLSVAILGGLSVDVSTIDQSSCRLEGVAPVSMGMIRDVSTPDSTLDCTCNAMGGDGFDDLVLTYLSRDIAAAMSGAAPGDTLMLTLEGRYFDGMPFSAGDCVVVIGNPVSPAARPRPARLGFPSPNPFNPITRIALSVPTTQFVRVDVYDVAGRLVETLVNEVKSPGDYVIDWNANGLSSGVYFYRMQTATETVVRRATLLK